MRRPRPLLVALALLAATILAGCGGGGAGPASSTGGGPPESAGFVPVDAPLYVYANTDTGGSQWQTLDSLSKKFPDRQQLLNQINTALSKQGVDWNNDVKPALGPELGIAALSLASQGSTGIGITKPQDESKLKALLVKLQGNNPSSKPPVLTTVDGWTIVSDKESALEAAKSAHSGTSLADSTDFQSAMAALPDDALAKVYVNGQALTKAFESSPNGGALSGLTAPTWIAAALQAKDDGLALSAISKGGGQQSQFPSYKATLVDQVPAGALLYISFDDVGKSLDKAARSPVAQRFLGAIQQALGVTFEQVASLFGGEGAIYVRPGIPLPEVTIVLKQSDDQSALATLDKLAQRLSHGTVQHMSIDGVAARRIRVSQLSIYYGAFDGKLVITDSPTGITGLKDGGQKLSSDPVFKDATSAVKMPAETKGFVYVNVKDTVPLIEGLSAFSGSGIPPSASSNLEHVRSFVAFASGSGGENRLDAFLEIR